MTEPDTTTMSGAEFQRHVGTDAAEVGRGVHCSVNSAAIGLSLPIRDEHVDYAARWFRDYAEVCVNAAVRDETEQAMRAPRHEP